MDEWTDIDEVGLDHRLYKNEHIILESLIESLRAMTFDGFVFIKIG